MASLLPHSPLSLSCVYGRSFASWEELGGVPGEALIKGHREEPPSRRRVSHSRRRHVPVPPIPPSGHSRQLTFTLSCTYSMPEITIEKSLSNLFDPYNFFFYAIYNLYICFHLQQVLGFSPHMQSEGTIHLANTYIYTTLNTIDLDQCRVATKLRCASFEYSRGVFVTVRVINEKCLLLKWVQTVS